MRLLKYDLTAFGPFTGLSLDLSAPGVHLVTGPNEAGKSTALHALSQLLYGIDERSRYDFVHTKNALRLDARLQDADGSILDITRVKSRKAPLLDGNGTPLDQARLTGLLGGIDRTTFTAEFALTSDELRRGGQALVEGGGQLGQALAASRSGLVLTEVQRAIDGRRSDLFKPNGSLPRVNTLIRELKDAQARKRQAALRPDDYLTLERSLDDARRELQRISTELAAARTAHGRLVELGRALPALARHAQLLAELDEVIAEGPLAPAGSTDRFPELVRELRQAEQRSATVRGEIAGVGELLAELVVDERLLAAADDIDELERGRQAAEDAAQLLARSAETVTVLRSEAAELLARVHPEATLADRRLYDVPEAMRTAVADLKVRHTALAATLEQSLHTRSARGRKLAEAQDHLAASPPAAECQALRAALEAVPADLLSRITETREHERKLMARADRLGDELRLADLPETLHAPSRDEISSYADELTRLNADRGALRKNAKALAAQTADRRLQLAQLLGDDPPPTAADLAAARTARDELWAAERSGESSAASADAYERAVEQADLIADRMFQNADRISSRRQLERQIAADEQARQVLTDEETDLDAQAADLDVRWDGLWSGYAGPAPSSDAAPTTLDRIADLRSALHDLGDARSSLDTLTARAVEHAERLRELLREFFGELPGDAEGEPVAAGNVSSRLPELQLIAADRLSVNDAAAEAHAAALAGVTGQHSEYAEAEALVVDNEALLEEWAEQWRDTLHRIDLPPDRDPDAALADLDHLDGVARKVAEADRTDLEVRLAKDRLVRFHDAVRGVADTCELSPSEDLDERFGFVAHLHARSKENRSTAERRAVREEELARHRTDLKNAGDLEESLREELAAMLAEAGAGTVGELESAVRRRQRDTTLNEKLREVRDTIALNPGESLEDLAERARRTDRDALDADIAERAAAIADLEAQHAVCQETVANLRSELGGLRRVDASASAAQAAADAEATAAALVEEAEEYLRLELAQTILNRYLEEYREAQQDPVLERAGRLFRELTRGHFGGLELDQDGPDPIVLARRGNGATVRVEDLSEGTADQLYLALRLSSLERYAEEDRALPVSLDDIFMTFDGERSRAALKVLDGMADRFQIIVFSHEERMAGLAEQVLPAGRVHVHELPAFRPGAVTDGTLRPGAAATAAVPAEPRGYAPARSRGAERTCRSCGAALTYSGRGRPPVQCPQCAGAR